MAPGPSHTPQLGPNAKSMRNTLRPPAEPPPYFSDLGGRGDVN
jgi:hypothetical protein